MKANKMFLSVLLFALTMIVSISHAAVDFTIGNYSLLSKKRVSRTEYLYTFKADITNNGNADSVVSATLKSNSSSTIVTDGNLDFGIVPAGQTVKSSNAFSIRQDRKYSFDEDALTWDFTLAQSTKKVLLIGVDGLVYRYIDAVDDEDLNEPETPNFSRLTLSKAFVGGLLNTGSEQVTSSGPGWTSILTGTWTDQHGVTSNNKQATAAPGIFSRLYNRNNNIHTASYVHWRDINTGHFGNELPYMENHTEGVSDENVANTVVTELSKEDSNLDFIFVQLDDLDHAGHSCGYAECYEAAVSEIDVLLGKMLDVVENRESLYNEKWLVMIVADHGHKPKGGHGDQTIAERTSVLGVNHSSLMNSLFYAPAAALPLTDDEEQNDLMGYPAVTSIVPTLMEYLGYPARQDDHFAGTTLLNSLGAHKIYPSSITISEDNLSATVALNWQVGDGTSSVRLFRENTQIAQLSAEQNTYEDTFTDDEIGSGNFDLSYTVMADTGSPVSCYVGGTIGPLPDIADIMADASMVTSFDDELSPFTWVAGSQNDASFEEGPFDGTKVLIAQRELGYATLDKDIRSLKQFSFGFWFKVNGDVSDDPNIISNKDWAHGYNQGFTVAVKSSGIKLNLGDGSNRADTAWLAYTKNEWVYVFATMDLTGKTMTLYVSDPEKGFVSSTVSTGKVGSMGSNYPLNIGEGGDGDYNVGMTLDFNISDLIMFEDRTMTSSEVMALAWAEKPLNEYYNTTPDIADIKADASTIVSFNNELSPFSWVEGTQNTASFESGPFNETSVLRTQRDLGYATLDKDINNLAQFSFGFWLKVNGNVTKDPNIISNKDWTHGYYKGFTLAVKSSGIKLNLGDGINRADTAWLAYTKDEWVYVFATMDLTGKTMTLYLLDPEKGFVSSTVSTGNISSMGSNYPLNIGEGGDGDYNVGKILDFNMSDLIMLEDRPVTSYEVQALANAEKPLAQY